MTQLTQSKREEVLDAYGHECAFCGKTEQEHEEEYDRSLDVHHIIPRRADGSNKPENLIPVCISCHKTLESTQADALERIEAGMAETEKEELESEISKLESQIETHKNAREEEKEERMEIAQLLEDVVNERMNITLYLVHETRFSTSRLLYVGTNENEAIKAFKESENHATMETANITTSIKDEDVLNRLDDLQTHLDSRFDEVTRP